MKKYSNILEILLDRQDLSADQMEALMTAVMTNQLEDAQIGAALAALRCKGESVTEIATAVKVMRELSTQVKLEDTSSVVDTCGTGGDSSGLFNVSTASAFVAAAAGTTVAKHGNRSNSSTSGSSDVLAAAGANINLKADQVAQCIRKTGIGFMFAPLHHSAMRHVAGVRRSLRVRTLFNLLGPLTNPAGAKNQVLGTFNAHWMKPLAEVLRALGSRQVLVVHSDDGLDEISPSARTRVVELKNGEITQVEINPPDYGIDAHDLTTLKVNSPKESLHIIEDALQGKNQAAADLLRLNGGAAIYVGGTAPTYHKAIEMATEVIRDNSAWQKWQDYIAQSHSLE